MFVQDAPRPALSGGGHPFRQCLGLFLGLAEELMNSRKLPSLSSLASARESTDLAMRDIWGEGTTETLGGAPIDFRLIATLDELISTRAAVDSLPT